MLMLGLLKELLHIAIPMVVSQVSDTVMLFFDRWMLSRLGETHLAAAMSGGLTQFTVTSFFIGMIGYVNALTAQFYGAGRKEKCAPVVYQGLYLALTAYPLLLSLSPLAKSTFAFFGHTAEQVELEYTYFRLLMYGAVFPLLRSAFTGFFLGIGKTRIVMVANLLGMAVNIPANYVLIYGKWGFPAWGVRGAALGTLLGSATTVTVLAVAFFSHPYRLAYRTSTIARPTLPLIGTLLRYGAPAGAELCLNVTAFNFFVLLMHSYGPSVAAAVTVAFNWDLVAFIPMLGMGEAVTSMVGRRVGAGNFVEARRVTHTALVTAWAYSFSMMALFLLAAPYLVQFFLSPETPPAPGEGFSAYTLAVFMLRFAGLYTLADSAQIVFSGALRGGGDTKAVMCVSVVLHWAFSLLSWVMIKAWGASPAVVWIAFILFVMVLGAGMYLRFRSGRWERMGIRGDAETETNR